MFWWMQLKLWWIENNTYSRRLKFDTIKIPKHKPFSYDGQGPDAYFYAGENGQPSRNGYIIANEKGSTDILGAYRKKDIVLTLPGGRTLKKIKWVTRQYQIFIYEILLLTDGFLFGVMSLMSILESWIFLQGLTIQDLKRYQNLMESMMSHQISM